MKTLTELSGSLVRAAAAAIEHAKRSLPAEQPAPPPPAQAAPAEATPADTAAEPQPAPEQAAAEEAVAEEAVAEQPSAEEAAGEQAADGQSAEAPAEAPGPEVPAALLEAAAKATGLSGDRLAMLCAAVEAVGGRVQDVRLVRVFGTEEPVGGAKTIRGHQYLVDLLPQSMKQVASTREEGGRRGGRGRGGGGRGGGGRGGGEKGTGGFSMDSLREDRKNQRGGPGRPGGGPRKPGGGGRPPGGAPRGR